MSSPQRPTPLSARAAELRHRQLTRRVEAAQTESRKAVQTSFGLLVAAEALQRASQRLVAHAVYDIGELSPTHGLTLCGLLAGEEAAVVPQMSWRDVDAKHQCADCAAEAEGRLQVL